MHLDTYFMHLTNLSSHSHLTSILCAANTGLRQFTCKQDGLTRSHTTFILNTPGASQFSSSTHQTARQLDKYTRWMKRCVSPHAAREQQTSKTAWRSHLES